MPEQLSKTSPLFLFWRWWFILYLTPPVFSAQVFFFFRFLSYFKKMVRSKLHFIWAIPIIKHRKIFEIPALLSSQWGNPEWFFLKKLLSFWTFPKISWIGREKVYLYQNKTTAVSWPNHINQIEASIERTFSPEEITYSL